MINGISLFANVGIGETYLKEKGINICVSNELIEKRADFYSHLYEIGQIFVIAAKTTQLTAFGRLAELGQGFGE